MIATPNRSTSDPSSTVQFEGPLSDKDLRIGTEVLALGRTADSEFSESSTCSEAGRPLAARGGQEATRG